MKFQPSVVPVLFNDRKVPMNCRYFCFSKSEIIVTKSSAFAKDSGQKKRARDGIRTRDPNLGKVVLHP